MPGDAPPGWYPDPSGSGSPRWWDGQQWTLHFRSTAPRPDTSPTARVTLGGTERIAYNNITNDLHELQRRGTAMASRLNTAFTLRCPISLKISVRGFIRFTNRACGRALE